MSNAFQLSALLVAALGAPWPRADAATPARAQSKGAPAQSKDAPPAVPEAPAKFPPGATEPLSTSCGPQTEAAQSAARMRGLFSKLPEPSRDGGAAVDPAQINDLLGVHQLYQRESVDYREEVRRLVEKRFGERRSQLSDSYEHAIHDREIVERQDRKAAIALFEEFLKRYPTDRTYSADASFRLAELYYERGQDDYNLKLEAFQQQSKDFQAGKIKEEPTAPAYDFHDSVALYRHMLAQWPDNRLDDAISYLLGYCLEQENDREGADLAFAGLIEHFPKSRFVPEAWLRQGESYFDAVGGDPTVLLQRAAAAYLHVLEFPDQPLYDKAIYKLGWTYYRLDDFPHAVSAFARLLDYYQDRAKKSGEKTGDMQNEAVQYMAISFADEKWGSVDKAVSFFQQLGGRPYEKDIFRRIGDVFYDQTRNGDAVAAYRIALMREPNAPDAPQIQAKIVQAFERDRAFDKQTAERERLVANYAEGTAWYRINKNNSEAVIAARQLTERALRDAALYHIQQAIAFKKDGKVEPAFTEFKTAAAAFGEYLNRYPHTKDVYDLTYYYADALYNSLQFKAAARQYEIVRDMAGEHQYQQPAAHDAVLALQNELEREQQAHQLPLRPVLKSTDRKGAVKVEFFPPLYRDLVRDSDAFVNLFPADPLAPAIAYRAAETFYTFNQFDEARCRFRDIIARWPRNEVAQYAANLTIETYLATQDWANVTAATGELLKASGGVVQKGSELEKTLIKFQLAGIFKLAQQEMDAGHYDRAAELFLELVHKNPQHEFADKALNNAAVCFEKTRRFDSALKTYERITNEYPKSALADQALFRVASDAEQSYDFDKAVSRYLLLVDKYPNSKNRAGALYNAARLLEGLQRYPEAASAYKRYAETFPKEADAPQNLFRSALVYEKMKDYPGEIRALEEFNRKFDRDRAQAELVVQSRLKMAQAYGASHNDKMRLKLLKETVVTYDRLRLGPDKLLGADAAAEAQFELLEEQFLAYDRLKIQGSKNVLTRSFTQKTEAAKKLRQEYLELVRYKRPEWILAAFYRKASVLEHFANSIYDAPVPPEIKSLGDEAIAIYQEALANKATSLESQAVDDYVKTLEEARRLHIVNQWTKKTLEGLNRYRPKDYPLLKDPREELALAILSPMPLAPVPEGFRGSVPAASGGKLGGGK